MSKEFDAMLTLFGDVAQGRKSVLKEPIKIENILRISEKHSCYYLVALAIKENECFNLSDSLQKTLLSRLEIGYSFNISRYSFCLKIFEELNKNDIKYVCLKGYSVYPLYKNAFYRISGDIDLLINEKDEKKTKKILYKFGFKIEEDRIKYTHHSRLKHPVYGLLELHTKLFEDDVTNIWFASKNGALYIDTTPFQCEQYKMYILLPCSQILQLFFHLAKHFIEGGLSIRAMMDFVLATKKYHKVIDFRIIRRKIKESGMEPFYDAIMSFMVEYCGIDKKSLPKYNEATQSQILLIYKDLETGTWIGRNNMNSRLAMKKFADKKRKLLNISNKQTILKRDFKSQVRRIFPHKYPLAKKYPFIKKYAFLYPIAVLLRVINYIFKQKKQKEIISCIIRENDIYRINLFKEMKIL